MVTINSHNYLSCVLSIMTNFHKILIFYETYNFCFNLFYLQLDYPYLNWHLCHLLLRVHEIWQWSPCIATTICLVNCQSLLIQAFSRVLMPNYVASSHLILLCFFFLLPVPLPQYTPVVSLSWCSQTMGIIFSWITWTVALWVTFYLHYCFFFS